MSEWVPSIWGAGGEGGLGVTARHQPASLIRPGALCHWSVSWSRYIRWPVGARGRVLSSASGYTARRGGVVFKAGEEGNEYAQLGERCTKFRGVPVYGFMAWCVWR